MLDVIKIGDYMIISNVNNYKDYEVIYVISKILYKNVRSECKFFNVCGSGSSSSKVYLFKSENNKMYAVKICNVNMSRVSLHAEAKNISLLEPFLNHHLPHVIYVGRYKNLELMISECLGIDSFFSSYISNKKPLCFYLNIWESFLLEIINMWKNSMSYDYDPNLNPRNTINRIKRIKTSLLNTKYNGYNIEFLKHLKIEINGVNYSSLEEVFDEFDKIGNPGFGVTCHGDPQPSNIIISNDNNNNNNWYLVDWEWSGKNHDYRLMFSHLYGWWGTRLLNLKDYATFEVRDGKLVINYEIIENDEITEFQNISLNMLKGNFDLSINDIDDINRFLSLLYFGDVRFLNIWGRLDYLPILIGEAVKTICFINDKTLPINKNFTIEGGEYNE